jgi:nuclear protein localization family protein 4
MVDHIEFENAAIVDDFIGYWRKTGYQRFGFMYGRYEPYEEVPIGIKAVVCCIYEPKQDCSVDGFELLPDSSQDAVDIAAQGLGLVKVGMIYTDLQQIEGGKIVNKRNASTFFISSLEAVFIAQMQLERPSTCKYSRSGTFGSKFVTVVITGDELGKVGLTEFQVSNAAMAMVKSDIIEPSVEPSLMRIKQSSSVQYIPELFYKYTNKYNVAVQEAANPTFPVDYLLVRLTHGFPSETSKFDSFFHLSFPPINREEIEPVKIVTLSHYFHQFVDPHYLLFCNFQVSNHYDLQMIVFLNSLQIFSAADFGYLLEAVKTKDVNLFVALEQTPSWLTLQSILADERIESINSSDKKAKVIMCSHCTFLNSSSTENCEMCGLPMASQ